MLNTCLTVSAWSVSVAVIVDNDLNNLRQVGNNEIAERDKKRQSEIFFPPTGDTVLEGLSVLKRA